ncbi:paraquat-inducible protein A [Ruegeria pomeroyi]|uniref:Paraquat-inducible protein A n=1 Tax=Ruegeria pomeroyi TaxID=89184 RepID=A0A850LNJ0_9RHOB|nr:paraquat-inducible protein A [Ruegeria pomeroyi]NVK99227.1 paraquat-inducible protein A [Ruegeria pomeroyi]NVL01476.1 paraquat-inducible protein A [Ruegeria pomeroyi]QWV08126.1 paraquat-inducible protein A [Ruegeria pomeroyi]HCE70733.1 paraquat-inducible membrane protein A [Ruegeria sp.]
MTRAADMGWIGCHNCGAVHAPGPSRCRTCGAALYARLPNSLQKVWAWLLTGVLFLIPANLYPLLSNEIFGHEEGHTILEGIVLFARSGDLLVAGVIFLASFVIPVVKVAVIALLACSVRYDWQMNRRRRLLLYEFVEFIGRWSMIDVFVVALLTGLVHLGAILSFLPGLGAVCFALSVICTMLSAQAMDAKLIWDDDRDE